MYSKLYLPENNIPVCLPRSTSRQKEQQQSLDQYLRVNYPQVASRAMSFLQTTSLVDNRNDVKVLNVLQGEIAHATSLQADIVLSTDATTCHVVALRSTSARLVPLVTVTHVDSIGYIPCLQSAMRGHIDYHQQPKIQMEIHMVGGFLDKRGTSQALSTFLISQFAELASLLKDQVHVILSTLCISSMNTTYLTSCPNSATPVARGLAIYPETGIVFMVNSISSFPSQHVGPAIALRTARLYSSSLYLKDTLYLIHDYNRNYDNFNSTTSSSVIRIQPFRYDVNRWLESLLQMTDQEMLFKTSTSPECEASDYCENIRKSIRFMQQVKCTDIFGPLLDQPLNFVRNNYTNSWNLDLKNLSDAGRSDFCKLFDN